MEINLAKVKNVLKDNLPTLVILGIAIALIYLLYFLYQNFYVVVNEKTPLEQIVIKEKINMDLYEQVKEDSKNKKNQNINWEKIKNVFY